VCCKDAACGGFWCHVTLTRALRVAYASVLVVAPDCVFVRLTVYPARAVLVGVSVPFAPSDDMAPGGCHRACHAGDRAT